MENEKEIEQYLSKRVRDLGGKAYKFVSPGCSGVPDRIVVLPGGRISFLELKAPGERPRKDQALRLEQLRQLGCIACWADSKRKVDAFLACASLSPQSRGRQDIGYLLEAGRLI